MAPGSAHDESKNSPYRWYALYLRSRHEKVVDLRLREREVETYLPMIQEIRQYSDRKKKVFEPLFKGYLFVRTDLKNKISILQTEGVVKFVGIGIRPSPIPDCQIDSIRIADAEPGRIKREPYVNSGELVKVRSGPLEGVQGFVTTVKGSLRVVLSVDCIGQSVSVEVAPEMVEKITGEQAVSAR